MKSTVNNKVRQSGILYSEVQYNRQIVPLVIIGFISLFLIFAAIWQLVLGKPLGNNPAPDAILVVFVVIFGLVLPLFFFTMNLKTEVRTDGLYYRFFPFNLKYHKIAPEDLSSSHVRIYNPLAEYGGWGIRFGFDGTAYNVSGNKGVQLQFPDRRSLLIGSSNPEGICEAIDKIIKRTD